MNKLDKLLNIIRVIDRLEVSSLASKIDLDRMHWWKNPLDLRNNPSIIYDGKRTRVRASMLLIRDGQVLLSKEHDMPGFAIPGGALDIGETPEEAATRETREEVRMKAKNVRVVSTYIEEYDEVAKWVKDNVPENEQWYNYYTFLCIGEYDGEYKGYVEEADKDFTMTLNAKWYDIKDAIKMFKKSNQAEAYWTIALEKYLKEGE